MSLGYAVREGMSGFRRAKLSAAGSVITITISLLLLGLFHLVSLNMTRTVEGIRARVVMEAFLREPVTRKQISDIQQQLLGIEGIERVEFISKEDAARIFKEEFGEDIGSVLDFNPLPPSFRISVREHYRTAGREAAINTAVKGVAGIEDVAYRNDVLLFLDRHMETMKRAGLGLGALIGISAVFLVSNTIRLAISAKRKAIQTMKLVGASRWFVRAPFLVEGIVQGLLGGILAAAVLYEFVTRASALFSPDLAEFFQVDRAWYLLVVAAGTFLGFLGSLLSVRRFIGESVTG